MSPLSAWLEQTLGHRPRDLGLFERALTHSSLGVADYERLEFLGDRVLGLCAARWLYDLNGEEPEGQLSRRLNALVSGETCAAVGRELGVPAQLKLGKQARDDGAQDSDNVVGDAVESLIGALFLETGLEGADAFIRRAWAARVAGQDDAPRHPKSALQEWAAAKGRKPPVYETVGRSGPHHAPTFIVEASVKGAGSARAEGASKQEAETEAAARLLELLR